MTSPRVKESLRIALALPIYQIANLVAYANKGAHIPSYRSLQSSGTVQHDPPRYNIVVLGLRKRPEMSENERQLKGR